MVGKKRLTNSQRERIKEMIEQNYKLDEIAKEVNRDVRTIKSFIEKDGDYANNFKGPQVEIVYEVRKKIYELYVHQKCSFNMIRYEINMEISNRDIKQIVRQIAAANHTPLTKQEKCRKSYVIANEDIQERLDFCRTFLSFGNNWNRVIFNSVHSFSLNGELSENNQEIKCWAAVIGDLKLELKFLSQNVDPKELVIILENTFVQIREAVGQEFYLIYDFKYFNSNMIMQCIKENRVEIIDIPDSQIFNPMEKIFNLIDQRLYANKRKFNNIENLISALKEEWSNLSVHIIQGFTSRDAIEQVIFDTIRLEGKKLNKKVI